LAYSSLHVLGTGRGDVLTFSQNLHLTACRPSPGCLLPVAICSANTTTTWIAEWRSTRSVPGGSHQQVDSCVSILVGICFCRWQKPLGSILTEVCKTGLPS